MHVDGCGWLATPKDKQNFVPALPFGLLEKATFHFILRRPGQNRAEACLTDGSKPLSCFLVTRSFLGNCFTCSNNKAF